LTEFNAINSFRIATMRSAMPALPVRGRVPSDLAAGDGEV
jgi:hypothetical protein